MKRGIEGPPACVPLGIPSKVGLAHGRDQSFASGQQRYATHDIGAGMASTPIASFPFLNEGSERGLQREGQPAERGVLNYQIDIMLAPDAPNLHRGTPQSYRSARETSAPGPQTNASPMRSMKLGELLTVDRLLPEARNLTV